LVVVVVQILSIFHN